MTKMTKFKYAVMFRVKHFPNLIVRLFTLDKCYICEECHKIHKRDGEELRLEGSDKSHRTAGKYWFCSVSKDCYNKLWSKVRGTLMADIIRDLELDKEAMQSNVWVPDSVEEY